MAYVAKRVHIFAEDGVANIPGILIQVDEYTLAVEEHPHDHGYSSPLGGRNRVYFCGSEPTTEEIGEIEISDDLWRHARAVVHGILALQAEVGLNPLQSKSN